METDKRKSEASQIEKEQFLAIFENLIDGLMFFDVGNKLLMANPAVEDLFNLKKENILGKTMADFFNFPDIKKVFYLLGEEISLISEKELEVRDDLILEVSSIALFGGGKRNGTLVILHDITREKRMERMKSEFITVSAHQLRTPLSAINWVFEALSEEKLTKDQNGLVEKGILSARRTMAILDSFWNVAKVEQGKYLGQLRTSDFREIVESVMKSYQGLMEKKKIKFEFQVLSKKLPKVKIDRQMIILSLQNLFNNAIKYTKQGGVISVILDSNEKEIKFSIEDTGIGIPEQEKNNIFQKFYRASNALKMDPEGNGLNLFVVKNIIEAHGGKIWFSSEEQKGTNFSFTIPFNKIL